MLTLPSNQPRQYTTSKQLIGGDDFNALVAELNSGEVDITAGAGGTQATGYQLKAAVNTIKTVTTANDGVKLPKGFTGLEVWVQNRAAANSATVFTYGVGSINNTDGAATGVALAASKAGATMYKCIYSNAADGDVWVSK